MCMVPFVPKKDQLKTETKDLTLQTQKLARSNKIKKDKSKVTQCEHVDAKLYAHGFCRNCYHTKGRNKQATGCEHKDRKLYARTVCKGCYLRIFHRGVKSNQEIKPVKKE